VLLALAEQEQTAEIKAWTTRGRAYLLATQERTGWRNDAPSGSESLRAAALDGGLATLALLATKHASAKRR